MATHDGSTARDARVRRAAATIDRVDKDVVRELTMAKARVDQANETASRATAERNALVVRLREQGVQIAHIAYLLGLSYDMVVLIVRESKKGVS